MTRITATLLIALAFAASAHGGEDSSSLLYCGVNLGGKATSFQPASRPDNSARDPMNLSSQELRDDIDYSQSRPDLLPQMLRDDAEHRLPAVLTLARVGCSWR